MDIDDIASDEYVTVTPDTRVSKLAGLFEDPSIEGVVVAGDEYEGVVTRRQLGGSRHPPQEKVGSLAWSVPRLSPNEDIRRVARLMVDAGAHLLPVFEGETLVGVVTDDDLLRAVQPHLSAVTVGAVYSDDLVSLEATATVGEALTLLREHGFTHLPVLEDGRPVGMISRHDLTDLVVRSVGTSRGGTGGGTDAFGGDIDAASGRSRGGGFGAREGDTTRVLDLPVRDVMTTPVRSVDPEATLADVVDTLGEFGGSSLVVTRTGRADGIVTTTDLLRALSREAEGNRAVQVYGSDLLDDVSYGAVVEMVDGLDDRDGDTRVIDARIHLHEHDERRRGTPLILARVRLMTDGGLVLATGEGYGASQALSEARDVLQRRIRDRKTRGRREKTVDPEFRERRFAWRLEE